MRKTLALLIAVVLVCFAVVSVWAHEVPDMTMQGSISITMHIDETAVGGGTLTLYRVGDVVSVDGNYKFALTAEFAECNCSLEDVQSAELANDLAGYANEHSVQGSTGDISSDGLVTFGELKLGLYLAVQETAAEGYLCAAPFLISVPYFDGLTYIYDVNASPKVNLEPVPTPVPTPTSTPGPTLPQTGQMLWPVPVFVIAGLLLFSVGWFLRFGKKDGYES